MHVCWHLLHVGNGIEVVSGCFLIFCTFLHVSLTYVSSVCCINSAAISQTRCIVSTYTHWKGQYVLQIIPWKYPFQRDLLIMSLIINVRAFVSGLLGNWVIYWLVYWVIYSACCHALYQFSGIILLFCHLVMYLLFNADLINMNRDCRSDIVTIHLKFSWTSKTAFV